MSVKSVRPGMRFLVTDICVKSPFVRSGIRTHAYISRLRPERSALDHSAILTVGNAFCMFRWWYGSFSGFLYGLKRLIVVGFEPTPPKWLVPKTSALDHSATLPCRTLPKWRKTASKSIIIAILLVLLHPNTVWQRWDSNPRHRSDWCLKPAP